MSRFQLLLSYLRSHLRLLCLLALTAAVFLVVLHLFNLPVAPVWYAALLCTVMGLGFFTFGFYRYTRRYDALQELLLRLPWELGELPQEGNAIEAAYGELLRAAYAGRQAAYSQADAARQEAEAYYTLWAHQIKTPISALRLLLQSGEVQGSRAMQLELFKIEQYVEMVLQFQRLDSMHTDLVLRHIDLDSSIRQAVRKFSQQFIHQKITLDFQPTGLQVLTDEKWLLFVLEQLLSNALKYTPAGRITIKASPTQPQTLLIADTGIGIRAEDLPRIFEKGFTGYNGREHKRATGIGLYLSKQILDNLGHAIHIDSAVGEGTCVTLDLREYALEVE